MSVLSVGSSVIPGTVRHPSIYGSEGISSSITTMPAPLVCFADLQKNYEFT